MVSSTFVVSVLGLANLGVEAVHKRDHLRFSMSMEELNELWEIEPPAFGSTPADHDFEGSSRRRLAGQELHMPDYYYERCVFWINSARAREGLPALQRWRDFEPCSDRTAKYDNVNGYHESVKRGLYCDWSNYMPIGQNTCPFMHKTDGSNRINQDCTMAMWNEKSLLEEYTKEDGSAGIRCEKDQSRATGCAGHYLTIRGGEHGYNAYDRVACGFHLNGNEIWINQNFGSGSKTKLENLKPADQWTAPKDWVPSFEPGFECGGDADTIPRSMLVQDCDDTFADLQYNECAGAARQDYHWWGCAFRHAPVGCDHGLLHDKTQLCDTQPFDNGFGPTPSPVAAPITPKPTAGAVLTPKPTTPAPTTVCNKDDVARKCKKAPGCMYLNSRRGCEPRTGPCSELPKKGCKGAHGCEWIKKGKLKGCTELGSVVY